MASQFIFEAIGTKWVIDISDELSPDKEKDILEQIKRRIEVFDKDYSRFRDDSLVTRMSKEAGVFELPADALPMMSLYQELFHLTNGKLTPLIGQVMVDSGYDALYSLEQSKELIPPEAWDEVLEYKYPNLTLKKPMLLDFGAAGKGYLIDIVAGILDQNNVLDFCIDAGGDLLHRNPTGKFLKVGLENPGDFSQVVGTVEVANQSLCGSAGSRRKWKGKNEDFHHIIDPHTLHSPKDVLATWVVTDTTLLADALATSLFFVEPSVLTSKYTFEYVILYSDRSFLKSDNFLGEVFN